MLFIDQSPLESSSQPEAGSDPNNTVVSAFLAVPESSIMVDEMRVGADDMTRAFDIEARVICTRAANILEDQPEVVMDESKEEGDTSIIPCKLLPFLHAFAHSFRWSSRC